MEADALNFSVFRCLCNFDISGSCLHFKIGRYRIIICRYTGYHILIVFLFAGDRPNEKSGCLIGSRHFTVEFDCYRIVYWGRRCDGKHIAADLYRHAACNGYFVFAQYIIGICQ